MPPNAASSSASTDQTRIEAGSGHDAEAAIQRANATALRRRLRDIGHLLSGNMANALISLAAVALTARGLGPTQYGVLTLAFSFARAIEKLITFQSWQPLIRYGAGLTSKASSDDLAGLLKFGLLLDIVGAMLAFLVAIALTLICAPLFGWSAETQRTVLICCAVLPLNINGMPTAVLRLFGKFRIAAWGPVLGAIVRLAGCAVALTAGAGLTSFAILWSAGQAIGYVCVLALAFRVLRQNGVGGVLGASLSSIRNRFPGIWGFSWSSNISLTLRSSANQLDVLIVGWLAGPAAAGLYHIAKRAGRVAEQVSTQAQAVLFPDVTRLWVTRRIADIAKAVWQMEIILILFGLGGTLFLLFAAAPMLDATAGPEYVAAAPLLITQMLAVTFSMAGSGSRSALLAMGQDKSVLNAVIAGTIAFHLTALALVPLIGPMGANIAHIVLGLIASGWMMWRCRQAFRTGAPG